MFYVLQYWGMTLFLLFGFHTASGANENGLSRSCLSSWRRGYSFSSRPYCKTKARCSSREPYIPSMTRGRCDRQDGASMMISL